jgi:transposase-like protein
LKTTKPLRSDDMTYDQPDCTLPEAMLEQIAEQGFAFIPELLRIVLNAAMRSEREHHLGAARYERSAERRGYANGYKPKTVTTRAGNVTFDVPQVRDGDFYPSALEKGLRSERALKLALAEMYVQGVSTRKVAAITEQLCGVSISSTQVSRAVAELDPQLRAWRERPLGQCRYLWLDARYEKVRVDGLVRDVAVLLAVGLNSAGKREVLGVSVSLSEAEVHWRDFMQSLVKRGLLGVECIVSDAHSGLQAARQAVFGGVLWQRCQFHLQQNAQAYVPHTDLKAAVAADIRAIFNAPDRQAAEALLTKTVLKYAKSASRLATWLEDNIPQGLTVFALPASQQRRLRTTNGLERLNREIRRRTRVAALFPNEASCLRLVTAIVMETSEEWLTDHTYIRLTHV